MKRILWVILTLLALAAPAWADSTFMTLNADEERRVNSGDVVVHMAEGRNNIKRFCIFGNIDAPLDVVYRVYSDFDHQKQVFSAYSEARVTTRRFPVTQSYLALDFPWPFGKRWMLNDATERPAEHVITSKGVTGTIKFWEDYLKLTPVSPRKTRVLYTGLVDPDLALPRWLLNFLQEQTCPTTITDVRAYIEKNHLAAK
jgi:hypothetical protein